VTRPVLVTGATGFLGSALARELAGRGHEVHAFARASSERAVLDGVPVRWHEGDLTDAPSVERAVAVVCRAGAALALEPWVVHSGAVISYRTGDGELQRAVNVGGTRHVLEACARHPVGRLLHVGSVVAVGHAAAGEVLDEDAPFTGAELGCDYVDTKRAAEELVLAAAGEVDTVVVDPGAIFGPGHSGPNTVQFLRKFSRRGTGPFAPPGVLSVVGRDDVVQGALAALGRGRRGRRYLLTESSYELFDLAGLAAGVLGVAGPRWRLSHGAWGAVVRVVSALDGRVDLGPLTPQSARLLGVRFAFRSDRARRELDWRPRPFEGVLSETVAWLGERGLLG